MADKQYAKACQKFEGSEQLDPALGTMLRLADCYDRAGKTASAWALFQEATSFARTRNEADRQRIASDRAIDLEKRLSKLELKIDLKGLPSGFELRLNGTVVPRPSWDTPIPVDPGRQQLDATAPDRAPWSASVEVPEGPALQSIEVPALGMKGRDSADPGSADQPGTNPAAQGSNVQRTIAYVAGGIAVAGLASGGFLAYKAYDLNRTSRDQCLADDPNACTPAGVEQRADAKRFATGATVAFAVSGPMLAGGLFLFLTSRKVEAPRVGKVGLSPTVAFLPGGARFGVEGRW